MKVGVPQTALTFADHKIMQNINLVTLRQMPAEGNWRRCS